jgi:hypothetical protein
MPRKRAVKLVDKTVRPCLNIKSRKHPDVQCPCPATQGDFCARHYKNPVRFQLKPTEESTPNVERIQCILTIQRWWKFSNGLLKFQRQGAGCCSPEAAENKTDIFSLDPVELIPTLYRWSYVDTKNHLWLFDVRSLSMTRAQAANEEFQNPYTREKIPETAEKQFQARCTWLRNRKYCTVHTSTTELSPDQLWHQRLLDVTMKYDSLGYHTCLPWFEDLHIVRLFAFYNELWELWFYRLNLPSAVKQQVVPNWNSVESPLFRYTPLETRTRLEKQWWQRTVLDLLDRLVSSAQQKEHKILGALYGMTAFAIISPQVRHHYPWLVELNE